MKCRRSMTARCERLPPSPQAGGRSGPQPAVGFDVSPTSAAATSTKEVPSPSMYEDATLSARSSNNASGSNRADAAPLVRTAAMACGRKSIAARVLVVTVPYREPRAHTLRFVERIRTSIRWPRSDDI